MLDELKKSVCQANIDLAGKGLVMHTFGSVSGIDRQSGHVVVKPSGVSFDSLRVKQMVVVSLESGKVADGDLAPNSDTPTHLELYRAFANIGGIAHAHSIYATAWAQARHDIPLLGTTHANFFSGPIPCTRPMEPDEINNNYEANTGKTIVERFAKLDPQQIQCALVSAHGPFTWGADPDAAVQIAAIVEQLARLASETLRVEPYPRPVQVELVDSHFLREY